MDPKARDNDPSTSTSSHLESLDPKDRGQLELFFLLDDDDRDLSHSVEFYDSIPKYVWNRKVPRKDGTYLPVIERPFTYDLRKSNGVKETNRYRMVMSPARIKDPKTGQEKEFYPGLREELVEDALRKIATEGAGTFFTEGGTRDAGVFFTLYQLREELKRRGHTFSLNEIKAAIDICSGVTMNIVSEDGKTLYRSAIFPGVALTDRAQYLENGDSKAWVKFHPLVSKSIMDLTFRNFNYCLSMKFRTLTGRWLHKRMSRQYTQASLTNTYSIYASTIANNTGMANMPISRARQTIEPGIKELEDKKVILSCKPEVIYDEKRKNRIKDIYYSMTPHPAFIKEMINFNRRSSERASGVQSLRLAHQKNETA